MQTAKKISGAALAVAAAGLVLAGCASNMDSGTMSTAQVHCAGVNSCKGQTSCKSASNDCKGKNSCKGKGWLPMKAEECKDKGGNVI